MTKDDEAERLLSELQRERWSGRQRPEPRLAELQRTVDETAAWCAQFLDREEIGTSLRPRGLSPSTLWKDRWDAVEQVAYHRRADVRVLGLRRAGARGRLLVYFPNADLCDGAAAAASSEFFDVHNAPPWGTWVGYFEDGDGGDSSYADYLLAWVPQALVAEAHAGISVNPEECIQWLDDAKVRLRAIAELLAR